MNLRNEPGWAGAFTRNQVEGAIPNGTRIVKCNSEPGDATPDGTPGIVLGSIRYPVVPGDPFSGITAYFIEWACKPRVAVGCMEMKVRAAE
jgi:hypothetical protein